MKPTRNPFASFHPARLVTRPQPLVTSLITAVAGLGLLSQAARAAAIEWSNTGTDWATGSNWVGGVAPSASNSVDTAVFGSAGVSATNVNLALARYVTGLTFNSGAFAYSLGGATLSVQTGITNNAAATQTINMTLSPRFSNQSFTNNGGSLLITGSINYVDAARTLTLTGSGSTTISGAITNATGMNASVAVTSTGTTVLSGPNSYDGTTSVSSGATLRLGNASSLGSTTAGTTVSSGGVLDLNGQTIGGEALTLSGTGISSGGAIVNSGAAASFGGGITLNANSSVGLSSGDITLGGNIVESVSRNLTLVGSGRLILSGINNYTGTTTLGLTTKLQVNSPTALASGSTLVTSNTGAGNTSELNLATANTGYALSSLTLGSIFNLTAPLAGAATLTLTNGGAQIGTSGKTLNPGANTTLVVGGSVGSSNFDLIGSTATADRSLTLGGAGSTLVNSTLRDNASGSAASFKGGIIKSGTGTATLKAANIYTGTSTVSGGVLRLENATAVPGGTGAAGGASNIAFGGGVIGLTATSGDFNRAVGTGIDQVIWTTSNAGTGGFAAYGGDRTVNLGGGAAQVAWLGAGPFGANGLILGASDSDSTITFVNPINMNSSTRTVTVNDGSAATDAVMTGALGSDPASLIKAGAGTLALTAINTYGGDTTVSAGTLHLRDDARLTFLISDTSGTSNRISGAGTLVLDGDFAIDTTVASALTSGTWTLENVPSLTGAYGSTFTVVNPDGSLWTDAGSNKWSKDGGGGKTWTFDETTGNLTLVSTVSGTPFQSWAQSRINDINPSADATPTGDPDKDGRSNLAEFAFNGNPLSGSDNGRVYVLAEDTNYAGDPSSAKELVLTVAVRTGTAVFAGTPSPNASQVAEGITYNIEGGVNLSSFLTPVNVVPTAVTTGLPAAGTGYEYRSFSLDGSNGLAGKGFLRVKVTSP